MDRFGPLDPFGPMDLWTTGIRLLTPTWKEKEPLEIGSWDKEFFKDLQLDNKFEVIKAANYLNIKGLLDIGCMTISNIIKENTVEDIRKIFNVVNDFTPEELEKIREENKWAMEEQTAESN